MAITIASRPASLDGCWGSWNEVEAEQVLRSEMDDGSVITRRRVTASARYATVSVILAKDKYNDFQAWYRQNCAHGSFPTRLKAPYGTEEVWRFTQAPKFTWLEGAVAFQVTCSIEQLPGWSKL